MENNCKTKTITLKMDKSSKKAMFLSALVYAIACTLVILLISLVSLPCAIAFTFLILLELMMMLMISIYGVDDTKAKGEKENV